MTKRLASLALVGAAAATFALPAAPASAACSYTPVDPSCVTDAIARPEICHRFGTYIICV